MEGFTLMKVKIRKVDIGDMTRVIYLSFSSKQTRVLQQHWLFTVSGWVVGLSLLPDWIDDKDTRRFKRRSRLNVADDEELGKRLFRKDVDNLHYYIYCT